MFAQADALRVEFEALKEAEQQTAVLDALEAPEANSQDAQVTILTGKCGQT